MMPPFALLENRNPIDKGFDCPCHGSCFDCTGANVGGPATIDMTRLDD